MRKSYLLKLVAYMRKVFKREDKLSRLNPTYHTSDAILPVFKLFDNGFARLSLGSSPIFHIIL